MRHKLMIYMEEVVTNSEPLEALIEADETYIIGDRGPPPDR